MSFFDTEEAHAVVLAKVHPVEFRLRRTPSRVKMEAERRHWNIIPFLNYAGIRGPKQNPLKPGLGQGRSAPQNYPSSLNMDVSIGDRRPPGSSVTRRLKAPAWFGAKKKTPLSLVIQ